MLKFTKMQGAGNDFILFDETCCRLPEYSALAKAVCNRRFGVGADGILIAQRGQRGEPVMRYYNSDGSRAAFCGNGLRCFARYALEAGLVQKDAFSVTTAAGPRRVQAGRDAAGRICEITVEMGRPELNPYEMPVLLAGRQVVDYPLTLADVPVRLTCVKVGVPHAVLFADCPPGEALLRKLGEAAAEHPAFPEGINLDIAVQEQPDRLQIFTWERGAGHTLACGTGCCAAAEAARLAGRVKAAQMWVETQGGVLRVDRQQDGGLWLTGPAHTICEGTLAPEWISGALESAAPENG